MTIHIPLKQRAAPNLALAIVAASNEPLLLLDGDVHIVAASKTFCDAFQVDPGAIAHRPLRDLGAGEWDRAQLHALLRATAMGFVEVVAYEMDLVRAGRVTLRLVLNATKLAYGDGDDFRLLLAVSDVTNVRANQKEADDRLRESSILLRELQHRVANSLQIIASVLLQSARKVQSDETRGYLHDAHHRVLSVAAVQQQLAVSSIGDVGVRTYLTNLCASIGASMIHDHGLLSLEVIADEGMASPEFSVSLGLIVTELVINALKHAFPNHRAGKIGVSYRVGEADWALSVRDDGVGLSSDLNDGKSGLGTSIVKALAKQLGARVSVTDARPGTKVSLVHDSTIDYGATAVPFRFAFEDGAS